MKETAILREEPPSRATGRIELKLPGSETSAVEQHLAAAGDRGFPGGVPGLVSVIRKGLPFTELEVLKDRLDIPLDALAAYLGLARATLHRRKQGGRLNPEESGKVLRFARLLGQATKIFGSLPDARQWLQAGQYGLGGAVPLDFAGTEVGAREVESLLGRIDYGVYS